MNNREKIWDALGKNQVNTVTYLPCNKLNALMVAKPENISVWDITKESSGLGLCFGRSLSGNRTAMMMQNTGLGNLVTELYTLHKLYEVGLPIFVSWRGHYQEPIEAQIIFGEKVEDLLNAIDVEYKVLESSTDLEGLEEDLQNCYSNNTVKVYLCSPELWEQNSPDFHVFGHPQIEAVSVDAPAYHGKPTMNRMDAIKSVMESIADDDIVISQIGFPSKELYNSKDRSTNFYMLGALGAATLVGIGLANSIEGRHVYVIDGDGSFFFNPNQLVDIASYNPSNLTVICLDNGSWGSTGNQPTLSSQGFNLSAMAKSLGIESTIMTDDADVLAQALTDKLQFIHYMIFAGNDKSGVEIPLKATEIKDRFMGALSS